MYRSFFSIFSCLKRKEKGTLLLSRGCPKVITVKTSFMPSKVLIDVSEQCGVAVCHADVDLFDIKVLPDGFIIYIDMKSEYRKVNWTAFK